MNVINYRIAAIPGTLRPFLLSLIVCACSPSQPSIVSEVERTVADQLKDPDSVEFRDVKLSDTGDVCGRYNAKNNYGAYTGYRRFMGFKGADGRIDADLEPEEPTNSAFNTDHQAWEVHEKEFSELWDISCKVKSPT
jgi:hypothetical protein